MSERGRDEMRRPDVRGAVLLMVAGLILGYGLAGFGQEQTDGGRPRQTSSRGGLNLKVAPWARPSIRGRHDGYYIGGGAAIGGEPRDVRREGTWGWDYAPRWTLVKLKWWHGRRFQDGGGEYRSDGKTGIGSLNLFR